MSERDTLAALLTDLFPVVSRSWWPFTVEQAADALIAAGVRLAPAEVTGCDCKAVKECYDPAHCIAPADTGLREAAQAVVQYLESDPAQTVVPDGRVRALRAALAAQFEDAS